MAKKAKTKVKKVKARAKPGKNMAKKVQAGARLKKVSHAPPGVHTVTPHLCVRNASQAIDFYRRAFGAVEVNRAPGPGGKLMHAQIRIENSPIFLADEFLEFGAKSPLSLGGSGTTIHLYVEDADAAFNRAVDAGAQVKMPLADQFWGDRYGIVTDPYGHQWSIATHKEDLSPAEMQKRQDEAMAQMASMKHPGASPDFPGT
jgi:uncharacterized glyoxalase superfamily protein PhnB